MSSLIHSLRFDNELASNEEFYDSWAMSYDKGNILQRLDDELFKSHLIPLLSGLPHTTPLHILDMGCGTGRNTIKLPQVLPKGSRITAVDGSTQMLQVAKSKLKEEAQFLHVQIDSLDLQEKADIITSTLVLEHLPLDVFFRAVGKSLKVGGWAWVTSMHPDMCARQAKASFTDSNGQKIAGKSWNHGIDATLQAAEKEWLKLEGDIKVGTAGRNDEVDTEWQGINMCIGFVFKKI